MADQTIVNGNLLLQTDPPNAAGSLSLSRTDAGATVPMAQISMYGGGTNNLQGILSFRTMSSGNPAGPLEERMRIDTNGNVGIGVPNPGQKLEVAGTVKAAAFQGNGAGLTSVTDATKVAKTGDTMTGMLNLPANGLAVGGTQLTASGGNVGIGTTPAANAKLHVGGFIRSLGLCVNDASNTGVGRGIWLWSANDPSHVIYSANPSGKSPANAAAAAGYFDAGHRLRLRTAAGQGFLFENSSEKALVDIDSDDGRLWTKGAVHAGNSDLYFPKTDHAHSGIGNALGYAAIENASDYGALMILGRTVSTSPLKRVVKLWDYLEVNGDLSFTGQLNKLEVADNFTATVRCADFCIGHSGRHNSPGRALVDYTDTLHINYGPDWAKTRINGAVSYGSSREYKENFAELKDDDAFDLLEKLAPVRFTFKGDRENEPQIGFIAEEVPRDIATADRKGINPMSIIGILTRVVKRQQEMLMKLQAAL